jgi:hypothetical protein
MIQQTITGVLYQIKDFFKTFAALVIGIGNNAGLIDFAKLG